MQLAFRMKVGIIAGPVAFQSDYGQRYDKMWNTGIGIGIIHYINFSYKQNVTVYPETYFNDHFKLRRIVL
jgi:hypothetical protein